MSNSKYSDLYLYITVFCVGAIILMLEILGSRIVAPYFGNTIYVWSSLISVAILSLSVGYAVGGWIADKWPRFIILYSIVFLTGLVILIIPKIDGITFQLTDGLGLRWGVLVASFILFSLPMVLMGTIAPFAIKLRTRDLSKVGSVSGDLYAISTFGSFVGAISTGFYLIPTFGINQILHLFAFILFGISGFWFFANGFKKVLKFLLIALVLIVIPNSSQHPEVVYAKQSMLGEVKVVDKGVHRILLVDGAVQSWTERGSGDPSGNFHKKAKFAFFNNPDIKDVLVIGLGSGSLTSDLKKKFDINIDTVEIDPRIEFVAKNYFNFTGDVIIQDGRNYIRKTKETYDCIIFDISKGDAFPSYLFTKESFEAVKAVLRKNGTFVVHFGGNIHSPQMNSLYSTLNEVFKEVNVLKGRDTQTASIIFLTSEKAFNKDTIRENIKKMINHRGDRESYEYILDNEWLDRMEKNIIITDDYNPLEIWQIPTMEAWRKYQWKYFGKILLN